MFVSSLYPVKVGLCQADCCRLGGGAAAGREEESEEEDFASRRDLSIEDQVIRRVGDVKNLVEGRVGGDLVGGDFEMGDLARGAFEGGEAFVGGEVFGWGEAFAEGEGNLLSC